MADLSIYRNIQQVEAPAIADAAQKGMNLRGLAMQQDAFAKKAAQEDRAQKIADYHQKVQLVGGAMHSLAGMPEAERAVAYPKVRQQLLDVGMIDPNDSPSMYDSDWFRSEAARVLPAYTATKDYLENEKTKAETDKLRREARNPSKDLTPGEKSADEAFGKEASEYYYGGGKSGVEKNFQRFQGALATLKENPDLTGGISTKIPGLSADAAQDVVNPKLASVRDDIRGAIQSTLKQVLGGQYTEKEGEAIFSRAFNPRLSTEENIRRATGEMEAIKRMADEKDRSMQRFMTAGTLRGYRPSGTNLGRVEQPVAAQPAPAISAGVGMNEAVASESPAIKPGSVEDGHVYLGGDPANPNSWKRVR
jgi:hypothetical protein